MAFNPTPSTDLGKKIAARAEGKTGGIKNISEGRSDIFRINPKLIEVEDGFNARDFDSPTVIEHIDNLARSIAQVNVKRPLKVRNVGGKYVLTDGECRLRATWRAIEVYNAEIVTIPVMLADRHESAADATLGLIIENSGMELTPLGKADVVKRLKVFGWSEAEIADKAGMSRARVTQLLEMVGLSEDIKALIRNETISPTLALDVARANDFDEAKTLEDIRSGQEKVAAKGKTRVTKRAVTGAAGAVSVKAKVAELIGTADVVRDEEDNMIVASFTEADWIKVCELLKISNGLAQTVAEEA